MSRSALALLLVLAAPACSLAQPYANYVCTDGAKLTVIFEPAGTALIMVGGGALRLADRRPASGLWFSSPSGEFRANASQATFQMAGKRETECRLVEGEPPGR